MTLGFQPTERTFSIDVKVSIDIDDNEQWTGVVYECPWERDRLAILVEGETVDEVIEKGRLALHAIVDGPPLAKEAEEAV